MLTVLSILGTRPEGIKLAPVVKHLGRHPDQIVSRVCVTAQHRHMLDQVLDLFEIVPDHDLDLMRPGQSPSAIVAGTLTKLAPILAAERPDWVLVQGDTATAIGAALAAFYAGVRVGHVEAGLRTHDRTQPFPEEIHRRIAGVVADLHFAPTERARAHLLDERVPSDRVLVTGNPVIDALHMAESMPFRPENGPLARLPWDRRLILVTVHRRENLGGPLESICRAVLEIARAHLRTTHIVLPVHPNPDVRRQVHRILGGAPGVTLVPALDYRPFVYLLGRSHLVLTDSGGLQEEAPSLGKPVLVLRNVTERPEAVDAGTVKLIGTTYQTIVHETGRLLSDDAAYRHMAHAVNPYGDGRAAGRIVDALQAASGGQLVRRSA